MRLKKLLPLLPICLFVTAAVAQTTASNIEQLSGWSSCDTCSGGGQVYYEMNQFLPYPVTDDYATQFFIGTGDPWAHALWWRRMGNDPTITHFVIDLDQYIEDPDSSQGIEYNANQIIDGRWYKFSTQCSFGLGIWQVWDSRNRRWTATDVPCNRPQPFTWSHLTLEYQRVNGQAKFISIIIDGAFYDVNRSFDPQPIDGAHGDFGIHFQLNGTRDMIPYSVWVNNLNLTYW